MQSWVCRIWSNSRAVCRGRNSFKSPCAPERQIPQVFTPVYTGVRVFEAVNTPAGEGGYGRTEHPGPGCR